MKRLFLLMGLMIGAALALNAQVQPQCAELFFSEYVEGSSNNKYIEVYNPTGSAVNLANYELRRYANGTSTPTSVTLSGTLNAGEAIVYRNSSATIYMGASTVLSNVTHSGDDAYDLYNSVTMQVVDIFGQIGCDPGSLWGTTSINETQNKTLRRNADVTAGVSTNPGGACNSGSFATLQTEWTEFAQDDVSDLGSHTFDGCAVGPTACGELFISEYMEGSSFNKCVEIYNPTNTAVSLDGVYTLQVSFNGGTSTGNFPLMGTIQAGDVHVFCDDDEALGVTADQTTNQNLWSGDDAISLLKNGTPVDIFGQVGCDPGSQWNVSGNGTQNQTLRRNASVTAGVTMNPTGACGTTSFATLGSEWTEFASNTADGFGTHAANGCAVVIPDECPTEAFISEFHYDNAGGDVNEFVEVAISNDFTGDLSNLNVILYNGSNGTSYGSATLDAFTQGANDGTYIYYTMMVGGFGVSGIQNGAPDGIALVCVETVEDFVSYEGTITATNGPAAGATSTDVGVQETSSTPVGSSVELQSNGDWIVVCQDSKGQPNTGITNCCTSADAFISEFHYDNGGTDVGEFIEIAVSDFYDAPVSSLSVVLYNGNGGGVEYDTKTVDQFIQGDNAGGFTYYYFNYPVNGIQNGNPDGIALVCGESLIEFISYEGSFTAFDGPAAGQMATDIGAFENFMTEVGSSIERMGSTWMTVCQDTRGMVNQGITECCDIEILSVNTTTACPELGGTITINASCSSCDGIQYSINGGASFQPSNTFMNQPAGSYQIVVQDQGDDTCEDMTTVQVSGPDGLIPAPWMATDVGNSGATGNAYSFDECSGEFMVAGGGNNAFPGTNADAVAFVNQSLCGDVTITAKLESVSPNGYGGVMIRETNASNAKQVSLFSNLQSIVRHEARYTTGGNKIVQAHSRPFPFWIRLQRQGDWIFGYYSTNGMNFQYVHAVFVPMNSCVQVGLASFSFIPGQQANAVFSNVSVTGGFGVPTAEAPVQGLEYDREVEKATTLFPNPATDQLNIDFGTARENETTIRLRNELGQVVEQIRVEIPTIRTSLDVSNLVNGMYFIEVLSEGAETEVLRFVKTR